MEIFYFSTFKSYFSGSSMGYFFGITKISFLNFFLGLMGGTLPLQIMFVALGDTSNKINILNLELKIF